MERRSAEARRRDSSSEFFMDQLLMVEGMLKVNECAKSKLDEMMKERYPNFEET